MHDYPDSFTASPSAPAPAVQRRYALALPMRGDGYLNRYDTAGQYAVGRLSECLTFSSTAAALQVLRNLCHASGKRGDPFPPDFVIRAVEVTETREVSLAPGA